MVVSRHPNKGLKDFQCFLGLSSSSTMLIMDVSIVAQDAVGAGGPLLAILGFCVLPIFWSIPEALVTAELATSFPEDSGYVAYASVSSHDTPHCNFF